MADSMATGYLFDTGFLTLALTPSVRTHPPDAPGFIRGGLITGFSCNDRNTQHGSIVDGGLDEIA